MIIYDDTSIYIMLYLYMHKTSDITFEDGIYVFNYTDEYGWVVTDWKTVEELRYNIREAMQLHFDGVEKISQMRSKWSFLGSMIIQW